MPPSTEGQWSGLAQTPGDSRTTGDGQGVFVIHAVLLHTGNVLWFSGHAETIHYLAESWVWDPAQPTSTATRQPFPSGTDIFCCHHASLEDGRVITVGGAEVHHGHGIRAICVFDPASSAWTKIGEMTEARWYPTLVTLPDGRLVVFSGRTEDGASDFIASTVELLKPPFTGPGYSTVTLAGANKTFPTYPGLHLVPGGRIVHTGTTWRYEAPVVTPIRTFSFRVTGPTTGAWTDEMVSPAVAFREEGMSVLLPPAQDGRLLLLGGAKTNASGGSFVSHEPGSDLRAAEILDTRTTPPTWTRTADMAHPRINLNAVLLPDARVLVLGGHNRYKWDGASTPSNQAEIYDPVLDTWTTAAAMSESRTYHSAALLLPDGRVVVAGGVDPTQSEPGGGGALNRKTLELYQPPYFFNGTRPTISSVSRDDGPSDRLSYGGQFTIETPNAPDIRKVALMRPGAMTHHTDSEQRYVALDFVPESATRLRVATVSDPSVAPPGYYMLWIVDNLNRPCQQARFVRLSAQRCFVIANRSHYSSDEVAPAASPATAFDEAFYVVMDGFLPAELGVTSATPTAAQLTAWAPAVTFHRGAATASTFSAAPARLLLEDTALPAGVRQRFTFEYRLSIAGRAEFFEADGTTPIETQTVTIRGAKAGYTGQTGVALTHQPNPYMLDGPTTWLSVDLRVFQLNAGLSRFGRTLGSDAAGAITYIQGVLNDFNAAPAAAVTSFNAISTDPDTSRLELARMRGGVRVFNFAIAQVRYRGRTLPANDVRVFFRLFTTAATGLDYQPATTYDRRTNPLGEPIPVIGLIGGEVATIPCFAQARVHPALQSMAEQRDTTNRRTIAASPSGAETTTYFGCWLDFNQTDLRFPLHPGGIGPYSSGLKSIQELIRGRHQCLVAEVHFGDDPIPTGAVPGGNDNLSQRNLAIVESDNPGSPITHTVQHTFEVKPTPGRGVALPDRPEAFNQVLHLEHAAAAAPHRHPFLLDTSLDELLIHWGNLPRDTRATLFLPGVGAEEILRLAALRIGPERLLRVDGDTVECLVGDVTWVPLPAGRRETIPGLLTLELPSHVKVRQRFKVVVQQVSGADRKVLGAFEIAVLVGKAAALLAEEESTLAVTRHILAGIPQEDRWHPVFARYVEQIAGRVRGFGGNPDKIEPSPDGTGGRPDGQPGGEDPGQGLGDKLDRLKDKIEDKIEDKLKGLDLKKGRGASKRKKE